jgi:hypothetical protein
MAIGLWLEAAFYLFCSACEQAQTRNGRLNSEHVIETFHSRAIAPQRITARLSQITAAACFHECWRFKKFRRGREAAAHGRLPRGRLPPRVLRTPLEFRIARCELG